MSRSRSRSVDHLAVGWLRDTGLASAAALSPANGAAAAARVGRKDAVIDKQIDARFRDHCRQLL